MRERGVLVLVVFVSGCFPGPLDVGEDAVEETTASTALDSESPDTTSAEDSSATETEADTALVPETTIEETLIPETAVDETAIQETVVQETMVEETVGPEVVEDPCPTGCGHLDGTCVRGVCRRLHPTGAERHAVQ